MSLWHFPARPPLKRREPHRFPGMVSLVNHHSHHSHHSHRSHLGRSRTISQTLATDRRAATLVARSLRRVPAPGLVLGGILGLQGGAALSVGLFPLVGPAGVVLLRLCFAAAILGAFWRPGWRWEPRTLRVILAAGTLLAVHHLCYYEAVSRIPLGRPPPSSSWAPSPSHW